MDPLAELVGESPAIEAVRDQIRRLVARRETGRRLPSVLLQGETGSGKGLVARVLHRAGPRARAPFVDLNCAAMPEHLVESELFGYERGAFTDARRAKPGLFQTAHRGVIFLDEIGELGEPTQAKLLKVLEEGVVRRLGATETEPTDVWVISATNADLEAAVRQRAFREDLYHRLAVLTLRLPPLRERGRDVILLATQFLAQACTEYGLAPKRLASDAEARLLLHPWPGNIRELGNVMERVALLAEAAVVTGDMLELHRDAVGAPTARAASSTPATVSLENAMREHVLAALTQTGWNISRTAALLSISRNTLRARIEKLGLRHTTAGKASARRTASSVASTGKSAPGQMAPVTSLSPPTLRWETRRLTMLRVALAVTEGDEGLHQASRMLAILVDKARTFGGHVDELSTRGLGAVFGLEPVDDAPRRAAHAAMAMQKAGERANGGDVEQIGVKVGIHVGEVLVAHASGATTIDADARRTHWAIVDTMLDPVPPGGIMVSAQAMPFLKRRFDLTAENAQGRHAYRLGGRERPGLAPQGRMVPFVGRRLELDLLKSRLASAKAGQAQVVGIAGEAGIGKSRLLYEFRQSLRGESVGYLEGHCLSYGNTVPYMPAIEMLRRACRITDRDLPEQVQQKLRLNLERFGLMAEDILPHLMHFLGFKEGGESLEERPPEAIRSRTFQLLRQMLVSASRARPLVVVVEDVHWIDPASDELGEAVSDLAGIPLLLIFTYRLGYRRPWLDRSNVTQISIQPLSADESLNVLAGVLPPARLSERVAQEIVSRADGNPFFLEELGRALLEPDGLTQAGSVPSTVQEVLLERINRLPDVTRQLLQSAAVIGKDVPADLLRAVIGPEASVSEALPHLSAGEFLYEKIAGPEVIYSFKHALTHEVAYESLRPVRRRELHALIVTIIEAAHAARLEEETERLARHAMGGAVWSKAVTYLRLAGERALARSANREAAAYFEQALSALTHMPLNSTTQVEAIDLRLDLRNALTPLSEASRTLGHLRQAEAIAREIGDQRRLGRVLSFTTNCLFLMGDYQAATASGRQARLIADTLDDFPLKTATDMYLGRAYQSLGDYRAAIGAFRRIVESLTGELMHEHLGLPVLPAVFSRSLLVQCLSEIGSFDEGIEPAEEAVRLARATTHPDTLLWAYRGLGLLLMARGEAERAGSTLADALALCQTHDLPAYIARVTSELGLALALQGRTRESLPLLEQSVQEAGERNQAASIPLLTLFLAEGYLLAERSDDAHVAGHRALDLFRDQQDRGHEAHALRLLADVSAVGTSQGLEVAEAMYTQADTVARQLGMRPLSARCQLGLGLLFQKKGEPSRARRHLAPAIQELEQMRMALWLAPARIAVAALS